MSEPTAADEPRRLHAVPAWGSPPEIEVDAGALKAGETDEQPVEFTETTIPSLTERVEPAAGEKPPGIPAWLTDPKVAREIAQRQARLAGLWAVRTGVQAPKAGAQGAWWTVRGAGKLTRRWSRWVWDLDGHPGIGVKPAESDKLYVVMAQRRAARQKARGWLSVVALAVLAVTLLVLRSKLPLALYLLTALTVVALARHGRPEGVKLLAANPMKTYRPRLTQQAIVAALNAVGIGPLTKALTPEVATRIWRSDFEPVRRGGRTIELQLPGSVLAEDLVQHEQRLASALVRPADTVIVEPLPNRTPSDLRLWIFDAPVLAGNLGPGPLMKAKRTSWWKPVDIGLTRNAEPHKQPLKGGAWFVGGQPSSGKSTTAQLAAAHTALDPNALLVICALKGAPSFAWAKPFAHRYVSGAPETDSTVIPRSVDLLRWLLDETARRNDFLTRLVEKGKAVGSDVTEDLAKKYPELRPLVAIFDEIHRLIDRSDNAEYDETVELLGKVIKACRSVAITFIGITQLAGTESIPPAVTRAARMRGCMTVQDEVSWRQIFGNAGKGSFAGSGVSVLPPGTIILKAEDGAPTKVGCWYLEPHHLAEIGKRALALRTDLDLLTGEAAGQETGQPEVSDPCRLLTDCLSAIPAAAPTGGPQDAGVAWLSGLETALGEMDEYAGRADGWLSGELRTRGVDAEKVGRRWVDDDGSPRQQTSRGVRAEVVRAAIARLTIGEG